MAGQVIRCSLKCEPRFTGGQRVGVWPWQGQEEPASEAATLRPHGGGHLSGCILCLQHHSERVPGPYLSHVGPQPTGVCAAAQRTRCPSRGRLHQRTHSQ